jgi:hypothetical protein
VNSPPALSPIPDQLIGNGQQLTFWANATDPDLPYGEHLTYSLDGTYPAGARIDADTGFFRWVVPARQSSQVFTITVKVTDSGGLSATQPVKITIDAHLEIYLPSVYH